MIPKILHQTWKTRDIPRELRSYAESWRRLHPGWEYRLWTDQSARELVASKYPRLLRKYDKYPYNIQRVDVARLLILAEYGGVCVDLDFEALRPIDALLDSCTLLTKEARADAARAGKSLLVSNAFIASEHKAPFLLHAIRRLPAGWPGTDVFDVVLNTTGPYFLTRSYESFAGAVKLLDEISFFSVGLEASRRPIDRESLMPSGAYAIHHFASSWWPIPALAVAVPSTFGASTYGLVRRVPVGGRCRSSSGFSFTLGAGVMIIACGSSGSSGKSTRNLLILLGRKSGTFLHRIYGHPFPGNPTHA